MTKKLIVAIALILISIASSTIAQDASGTPIQKLAQRILERLPDRRYTAHALGRGDDRKWRAFRHAEAAYAAADAYKKEWLEIAQQNEWEFFDPERDLAPLITAVAYRESSLREIVRLDGGEVITHVPIDIKTRTVQRADMGIMQVRAPSRPASACGVKTAKDMANLLLDINFSYHVGTCILTKRIQHYAPTYRSSKMRRLKERNRSDLLFYGVFGPRQNSIAAKRARELLVLERYNWGGADLYDVEPNNSYARRVIREFEFFREGLSDEMYSM